MILLTRTVDELGRIVLPQEMRQRAGIETDTSVDITQDESGAIHMAPASARCKLCGGKEDLHQLDVGMVCGSCVAKIQKIL